MTSHYSVYILEYCGVKYAYFNGNYFFFFFHFSINTTIWKSWTAVFLLHHPNCQLSSVCRILISKGTVGTEQLAFFRFQMEFVNLTGGEKKWVGKKNVHTCKMTKICLESLEKMNIGHTRFVYYIFPEYISIWRVNHSKIRVTNIQIMCN